MVSLLDDPRAKTLALVAGGLAAIGIAIYVLFVWKPAAPDPRTNVREAQTVEELVNTPLTNPVPIVQTPAVHLTLGRSACEDALIHYNGALRSHPDLAREIRAEAKTAGCGWAQ